MECGSPLDHPTMLQLQKKINALTEKSKRSEEEDVSRRKRLFAQGTTSIETTKQNTVAIKNLLANWLLRDCSDLAMWKRQLICLYVRTGQLEQRRALDPVPSAAVLGAECEEIGSIKCLQEHLMDSLSGEIACMTKQINEGSAAVGSPANTLNFCQESFTELLTHKSSTSC